MAGRMIGYRKQLVVRDLAAAEGDEVFAWCPLPAGSTLLGAWLDVFMTATSDLALDQQWQYGIHGNMLPVLDPDTLPSSPDDMWDKQVPKADPIGTDMGDLDTAVADTTIATAWEHYNINELTGQTTAPEEFFKRYRLINPASSKSIVTALNAYRAMDAFRTRIRGKLHVKVPSIAMLAVSMYPSQSAEAGWTGVDSFMPDSKAKWNLLGMPERSLDKALMYALGLETEGTGTMSSDEALQELFKWTEQVYMEVGSIIATTSRLVAKVTWQVAFPRPRVMTLTSGD